MLRKEIDALKKAGIYSIPPNRLGYCGPAESWKELNEFIASPFEKNALVAKEKLMHFNALYPYLELIAGANGLKPFDLEVIEAYWIGNELLENVSFSEIQKTILSFQNFGLPKTLAEKKAEGLPEGILPHHSMHVLYVNFISQKVKPLVQNLSSCLVQWASVLEETNQGTKVKGIELLAESGELKLQEKEKIVQNPFEIQLKEKDLLAVHWNNAIEKISTDSMKMLKKYTVKNLEFINGSGVFSAGCN